MAYTLDDMVLLNQKQQVVISSSEHVNVKPNGTFKIRAAMNFLQNARIILCTDYIAKDLQKVIQAGAVLIDEAGQASIIQ